MRTQSRNTYSRGDEGKGGDRYGLVLFTIPHSAEDVGVMDREGSLPTKHRVSDDFAEENVLIGTTSLEIAAVVLRRL